MARKSLIERDKRRQILIKRNWDKRQELKRRSKDMNITEEERELARENLSKMPRDSSPIRYRNRCRLTGRSRGYLRKFKLSRLCFREKALEGSLPGVTKSSW